MKTKPYIHLLSYLLIVLFVYTAASKLIDWPTFAYQMQQQPLPSAIKKAATWTLPAMELITAGCLAIRRLQATGFALSLGLMLVFTGYVALVLLGVFEKVPCSCGGVLQSLGWKEHLVFNIGFLVVAGVGVSKGKKVQECKS